MKKENLWLSYHNEDKKELNRICDWYKKCLDEGKTERECTDLVVKMAKEHGYQDLFQLIRDGKKVQPGDKLYAVQMKKCVALFRIGEEPISKGMNILGAHIDSPRIDVKQNPLYETEGFAYLDTHYYGGIKKYQWTAMPLALHGVVILKDGRSVNVSIGEDENDPDTMRWFEGLFHLSSMTECGWKFGIVHEAECLTEQAQNAFLKTLEEPPEKCAFVLTSGNPSLLLPTTRSRCQILRLTDSACVYRFPGLEQLPGVLTKLLFGAKKDLSVAGDCAAALLDIANALSDTAEKTVNEKWKPKLDASENLDSTGKKLLEKRVNGEISCEYLRLRDEFLSCLHTFFAQAILYREGVPFELLPNKELFAPPFPLEKLKEAEIDYLYHILDFAEILLRAMRTNANDDLAIRAFCLKSVFK